MQRFPPTGVAVFDIPLDGRSAWVDPFLPAERVTSPGPQDDGAWVGQRILQDPVYASARLPGVYETVDVELEFRTLRQPLLEIGLLRDEKTQQFEFRPIWFEPLQDPTWGAAPDASGYARNRLFQQAQTFAVWHASATAPLLTDPAREPRTTRVSLRGSHDVYAVPAGGRVQFTFAVQDVNRAAGPDTVTFRLSRDGEEIGQDFLGIGGTRDNGMGPVVEKTVTIPNALPGVYRIQMLADDDVFIRSITTDATRWVLGPRLVFADDVGFDAAVRPGIAWSNSRHLVLETFHNEGLQEIVLGSARATLARTHEAVRLDRVDADARPQKLQAPRGDVRIIGDGWFAFSPEAFFEPQPRRLTDASDPLAEGVTDIRTPYMRPEDLGDGWVRARATFQLDPRADRVRLALSAPGVLSRSGAVDIRRVRLTYRRPPRSWPEWRRVITEELRNAVRRIR
ncbi:MAG: hypothetical protein RL141_1090 [Candidatus Parcubacteria bacterium]